MGSKQKKNLRHSRNETVFCLLCGAPACVTAAFVPDDAASWGVVAEGHLAFILYHLCQGCVNLELLPCFAEAALTAWRDRKHS